MKQRGRAKVPAWAYRALLIVPGALALSYLTAAVSLANIAGETAPLTALRLYPIHGPSLAAAAAGDLTAGQATQARGLAQNAIRQSPLTPTAFSTLGLLAQAKGDDKKAAELMSTAFGFSRRELATTMWLIEASVRNDNVPQALRYYDVALRTSPRAKDILLPTLVKSASSAWMIPYLGATLQRVPPWSSDFADLLLAADVPPENKVMLADQLRNTVAFGPPFRQELVSKLAGQQQFTLAAQVAGVAPGYDRRLLHAFALPAGGGPFEWKLASAYHVDASFEGQGSDQSLKVSTDADFAGPAAKILLLLGSGQYRLESALSAVPAGGVGAAWTLQCATSSQAAIGKFSLTVRPVSAQFTVPTGCAAQWLTLTLGASSSTSEQVELSVRDLAITPG